MLNLFPLLHSSPVRLDMQLIRFLTFLLSNSSSLGTQEVTEQGQEELAPMFFCDRASSSPRSVSDRRSSREGSQLSLLSLRPAFKRSAGSRPIPNVRLRLKSEAREKLRTEERNDGKEESRRSSCEREPKKNRPSLAPDVCTWMMEV